MKSTSGSVERKHRSSCGQPSRTAIAARTLGDRNESRSSANRNPAETTTASARARGTVVELELEAVGAAAHAGHGDALPDRDPALDDAADPRRAAGAQDALRDPPPQRRRQRRERVGMEREPVQDRRPVAHHRVRQPVEPAPERAARAVRLAVGEPAQLRAHDELDLGAGAQRQRGGLQAALAAADDDDAAAAIGAVVLALDRERDPVAHRPVERRRRVGKRRDAHRDDDRLASTSSPAAVVTRSRPPARSTSRTSAGSLSRTNVCAEPVGVAQEHLQRDRLLARLAHGARPHVDGAAISGRREGGLLPVGAQQHVRRHRARQVCIGSPKTRTLRCGRCAATESPNGPAPTTATSSRSGMATCSSTALVETTPRTLRRGKPRPRGRPRPARRTSREPPRAPSRRRARRRCG